MNTTRTPKPTPTIQQLRSAITDMDALAHEGFSQIAAIARLALSHLETANGWQHPDTIARALEAIQSKAEAQNDCISSEAHGVGCAFIDTARLRRFKANEASTGFTGQTP